MRALTPKRRLAPTTQATDVALAGGTAARSAANGSRRGRRSRLKTAPAPAPVAVPVPERTPDRRRYHQTIDRIDVWTVLKVSSCFYLCSLVALLLSGIVLWYAGRTMGLVDNFESLVKSFFNLKDFELVAWRILRAATLIGVVVVCLSIVMTTLAAALYNLFAGLIGGVEVTVVEDEPYT